RVDGRGFTLMAACMDSGGNHTQTVYEFAKERLGRKIWAIKGESAQGGKRSPIWPSKRPTKKTRKTYRPIILGVNAGKDSVRGRLHIDPPADSAPSPGCMHFPADRDIGYFQQLLSERLVIKVDSAGTRYSVWELPSGKANEALDCRVYAYSALCGLIHMGLKLNTLAEAIATQPERLLPPDPTEEKKTDLSLPGAIVQVVTEKPAKKRMAQLLP
ncbi:MAG: terminase gpA endonuclease subunit, partial [Enterobacteriaceae bacterium]